MNRYIVTLYVEVDASDPTEARDFVEDGVYGDDSDLPLGEKFDITIGDAEEETEE